MNRLLKKLSVPIPPYILGSLGRSISPLAADSGDHYVWAQLKPKTFLDLQLTPAESYEQAMEEARNTASTGIHLLLDVVGMVPVVGVVADLTNAAIYWAEGDYQNAALSGVAAIPGVGYAAVAVKATKSISKAAKVAKAGARIQSTAYRVRLGAEAVIGVGTGIYGGVQAAKEGSALGVTLSVLGVGMGARSLSQVGKVKLARFGRKLGGDAPSAKPKDHGGGGFCGLGGSNSFTPETLVLMADGSAKRIDQVEQGDVVLAYDPESGQRGGRAVTDLIVGSLNKDLVELTFGEGGSLTATERHPFWSQTRQAWVDAVDLVVGESVLTDAGQPLRLASIDRYTSATATVHNLTVADIHTYFVLAGQDAVLVHNQKPRCIVDGDDAPNSGLADLPYPTRHNQGFVRADELLDGGNITRKHGINPEQMTGSVRAGDGVSNLSNDDLIKFGGPRGNDPITVGRSHGVTDDPLIPGSQLDIQAGHHRLEEIRRRVQNGTLSPDTIIEVVQPR